MEVVIAAAITGGCGLVGVLVQRMRRENTAQHAEGRGLIQQVIDKVDWIHDDVGEVKLDVREVKGRVKKLEDAQG